MAFTIVIPHRSIVSPGSLTQVGPCQWMVSVPQPSEIAEICVALTEPLSAANLGVGVSFGYPPSTDSEFLGVLTNVRPSDIFSTGWPWSCVAKAQPIVNLYLSVEPADVLLEKLHSKPPLDVKQELARKTALNLFRFVESFSIVGPETLLKDPGTVLDQWYKRFEEKLAKDKNFVLFTE